MKRWNLAAVVFLALVALSPLAAEARAQAKVKEPPRLLAWENERLVVRGRAPFARFDAIIRMINDRQFKKALEAIRGIDGRGQRSFHKALLAAAVAGHPQRVDTAEPLKIARQVLEAIPREARSVPARRLLHEIELFQIVPTQGQTTSPFLLPARDMIRGGDMAAGINRLRAAARRSVKEYAFAAWCLAAFFDGRQQYEALLAEAQKALADWTVAKGKVDKRIPIFERLLRTAREHRWAHLTVQTDSVLYPKVLLERLRAYFWWWKQMGDRQRPMSKQGFYELLAEIKPMFPSLDIVKMYSGQRVPWGEGFRPDPAPPGAPGWAVNQRELRARVDYVLEWWFDNRQAADGALSPPPRSNAQWEDDCEVLRMWSVTAFICGNARVEAGIRKLVDGIWNSGELVNGYDHRLKDVEHSSEMSADSSVMVPLDYGDPLQFERFLQTTKTTDDVHTAVNAHGHRHFKSISMSATATRQDVDTNYHGRAMRPAAVIAWYSGIPKAVELARGWAKAWSEDTVRAGKGKPAGIIPAVIRFDDDTLDGNGNWVARRYGSLYWWSPGRHDMVIGKMLGAWAITGDDSVLDGLRAQLRIMRSHLGKTPDGTQEGSAQWAGRQVARMPHFATWYRICTGDKQFDDIARRDNRFGKYLVTGDPAAIEAAHAADLSSMRFNLPMITSEVRGTDRVALRPLSLLGALSGSSVSITQPPMFFVTWRQVGPDFTALVRDFGPAGGSIWAYSFAAKPTRPVLRFWRLERGKYVLKISRDGDGDGKADGKPLATLPFQYRRRLDRVRFDLPPRTLCLLEIEQLSKLPALPARMPDLAIMARDLTLSGKPGVGRPCPGRLVIHNIGSADARDVKVVLRAITALVGGRRPPFQIITVPRLAYPADLTAKTAVVDFQWTPEFAGAYHLMAQVSCGDGQPEIYLGNNGAAVACNVAAGP